MVNINYRVAEYVSIPQANTLHYQYLTNDVLHTLFQLSKWQRQYLPIQQKLIMDRYYVYISDTAGFTLTNKLLLPLIVVFWYS